MVGFIVRVLIAMLGLWVASALIPGLAFQSGWALVGAAVALGIVNAFVRPIVVFLTLPITVVTLGLFLLVINAAMLGLVAWLLDGFHLAGFWSALFGAIVVSITAWAASWFVGPRGHIDIVMVRGERR